MPPRGLSDVRLRRDLSSPFPEPSWPAGFVMRTLTPTEAPALHALITTVFDDGADGPFEVWWPKHSGDPEFDPELCFLVFAPGGALVGAALCWTSGFIKDLAVHPSVRRLGLGEALMLQAFAAFRRRGVGHVDLKTSLSANADAVRLYRRLGMVEVDWEG